MRTLSLILFTLGVVGAQAERPLQKTRLGEAVFGAGSMPKMSVGEDPVERVELVRSLDRAKFDEDDGLTVNLPTPVFSWEEAEEFDEAERGTAWPRLGFPQSASHGETGVRSARPSQRFNDVAVSPGYVNRSSAWVRKKGRAGGELRSAPDWAGLSISDGVDFP